MFMIALSLRRSYAYVSDFNVASSVYLSKTNPMWIVDLGATNHTTRDHEAF